MTNHKCQLTSVAPSMTHDTSEPTTVFHNHPIHPSNFVSPSCHLVLHCLDQVTDHSPTQTHMLSLSTSIYPSPSIILSSLMANLIAIESRDDGSEAKRDEGDSNWRHKSAGMTENVKPLTLFSQSSFVPYASSALPQFKH